MNDNLKTTGIDAQPRSAPTPRFRFRRLAVAAFSLLLLAPGLFGIRAGFAPVHRGANDAGGEFDSHTRRAGPIPLSSRWTLAYVRSKGLDYVKVPFSWETVQPVPGGALSPEAVASLRRYIGDARSVGLQVVLDVHNYARFTRRMPDGNVRTAVVGDPDLPIDHFADLWRRLAGEFKGEEGILAYLIMCEPHNMVTKVWEQASQAAVEAIRAVGDRHWIWVPGNNYSSTHIWVMCHGRDDWIQDPLNHFAYEAHLMFGDLDPSRLKPDNDRLAIFVEWVEENGVTGVIGDFAFPPGPEWPAHIEAYLQQMDQAHMDASVWAVGERWPDDYPLSLQPTKAGIEREQWKWLSAHRAGRTSTLTADFLVSFRRQCTTPPGSFGRR